MKTEKKYEQWKAITESDFVTLFIKTWFTYIAALRETNPDINVFSADGMPRGDKPFLNAFKEGIMPIVQKRLPVDDIAQELFRMYPICMRKVIEVFPQYFFQTFYRINESFKYNDSSKEYYSDGKLKERYEASIYIEKRYHLRFYLGISGHFNKSNYNEEIIKDIDLRPLIDKTILKYSSDSQTINEIQFLRDFYDSVMNEIVYTLRAYLDETLPQKGYNKTVNKRIQGACMRLNSALNLKFEYNYKYPHEVDILDNMNSYAIIYQIPFNGFSRVDVDNIYLKYEGMYYSLISTKGIEWFADYVYALRNALFHEIISPLDEKWQLVFKSSYLILKKVADICIELINNIVAFPSLKENAVLNYVISHQEETLSDLAEFVELLDFTKMELKGWTIKKGKIQLSGWFLALLKLQKGSSEDIETGNGYIEEVEKGFSFEVTLNDDLSIAVDKESHNERISICLQEL